MDRFATLRTWALLALLSVPLGWPAEAATQPRIALVIGNGAYADVRLRNPVNDSRLMAATLRTLGFEVRDHADLDQKGMKRAIRDFADTLQAAGERAVGLFYYAGHAVQVAGRNYLIPIGAAIDRESDVDIEAVSADTVLVAMEFARNGLNIVILDACRDNPYKRRFRSATRGLARMNAPQGTLIAYATAPGNVAADGDGTNSPYTAALVEAMRLPAVPVELMFKRVRQRVMAGTKDRQVPWEASSLTGDFQFVPGATPVAVMPPAPPAVSERQGRYDGTWRVRRNCPAFETLPEISRELDAVIDDDEVTIVKGRPDRPGYEELRGRIDGNDRLVLSGSLIAKRGPFAGNEVIGRYEGRFAGDRYQGDGKQGRRPCRLTLTRAAP